MTPLGKAHRDWPASDFIDGHLAIGTWCVGEEGLVELGNAVDKATVRSAIDLIIAKHS